GVAAAGDVEDPCALWVGLVSADDPELVALVGRICREVVEKDDGSTARGVEEDPRRRRRRHFLPRQREGARLRRGQRGQLLVLRREPVALLGQAADLRLLRDDLLPRHANPYFPP